MPSFKLTIAYDGTNYVGWQRQASGTSIQGLLEEALSGLDSRPVTVIGAGRTDAGVHALGQVAAASLERPIDADRLRRALNARLPASVRVVRAIETTADFHPRFAACAKRYRYRMWQAEVLSPFERRFVWHVPAPLDIAAMDAGARSLEGEHDFAAFQAAGSETRQTERILWSSTIRDAGDSLLVYEVRGSGFLRHMVRAIVGSLVEVGRGRHSPEWIADVLRSKDRTRAGPTAPPEGLFLVSVEYDAPSGGQS